MYVSLINWEDLQNKNKSYNLGDEVDVSYMTEGRKAELLSPFNRSGKPVIRYVETEEDEEKPKRKTTRKKADEVESTEE